MNDSLNNGLRNQYSIELFSKFLLPLFVAFIVYILITRRNQIKSDYKTDIEKLLGAIKKKKEENSKVFPPVRKTTIKKINKKITIDEIYKYIDSDLSPLETIGDYNRIFKLLKDLL